MSKEIEVVDIETKKVEETKQNTQDSKQVKIQVLTLGEIVVKFEMPQNFIDEINNEQIEDYEPNQKKSQNDFLFNVNKVETIISRLESLENEKSALKEELKVFEDNFLTKKKLAEDEINKISQEKDMIEKTINVIKNLKSF